LDHVEKVHFPSRVVLAVIGVTPFLYICPNLNNMATKSKLEMGCKAKHLISKVEGIIIAKTTYLNGMIQYGINIQKNDRDGKPLDPLWHDENSLKRTGDGVIKEMKIPKPTETDIELGMTVKHFNGFTGTATEMIEYINGCVHIEVTPKVEDKNKMPECKYIPCQYLEVKGIKKPKTQKNRDKGGPPSRAPLNP